MLDGGADEKCCLNEETYGLCFDEQTSKALRMKGRRRLVNEGTLTSEQTDEPFALNAAKLQRMQVICSVEN